MEFLRKIINSNTLEQVLTLPPSFHDVKVEVIVLPVDNREANFPDASLFTGTGIPKKHVIHSAFGRLKKFANTSLIPKEEGAWEKAAAEKYALH